MSREPPFDYWRLLALVLFFAVMVPFGIGSKWLVGHYMTGRLGDVFIGLIIGLGVGMWVERYDRRRRAPVNGTVWPPVTIEGESSEPRS